MNRYYNRNKAKYSIIEIYIQITSSIPNSNLEVNKNVEQKECT